MRTLSAAVLTAALVIAPASLAWAGGSDDPTPYEVTGKGIQLPEGDVFPDNGHVNIRYTAGDEAKEANVHFEGKCVERDDAGCAGVEHEWAQYIGQSFLPWSVLGVEGGDCVEWVQLGHHNEHFGEGGQEPVCVEDPEPVATPEPKPTPDFPDTPPTEPGEGEPTPPTEGTDPEGNEPGTDEPGTDQPGTDEPVPSGSPVPVADETGTDEEAGSTPGRPQGVPVTPGSGGDAAQGPSTESAQEVRAEAPAELPRTGATVTAVLVAAVVLVLGGVGFLAVRGRRSV
ncbi:LPXTG cell wall anchor domain-containing protein [Isoptericola rhizosphaerae]|uniref:LPXTG cell wall anchor domain-containing protein n=1 Tax=Isoptericola rhizosphaerae TaxID=3377837 RepID=UPI00383B04EC